MKRALLVFFGLWIGVPLAALTALAAFMILARSPGLLQWTIGCALLTLVVCVDGKKGK